MDAGVEFVACDFPQANRLTIHILSSGRGARSQNDLRAYQGSIGRRQNFGERLWTASVERAGTCTDLAKARAVRTVKAQKQGIRPCAYDPTTSVRRGLFAPTTCGHSQRKGNNCCSRWQLVGSASPVCCSPIWRLNLLSASFADFEPHPLSLENPILALLTLPDRAVTNVRYRGKTGSEPPTGKTTRLTQLRHRA